MALLIDKLQITDILVRGHVPREQAQAFADAISETLQQAATESDIDTKLDNALAQELPPVREKLNFLEVKHDEKFQSLLERSDARFAEMQAQLDTRFTEMRADMNTRFAQSDARFAEMRADMNTRFTAMQADMDTRFAEMQAQLDTRFTEMRADMNTRFTAMQADIDTRFADVRTDMRGMEVRIYRAIGFASALVIAAMSAWAAFG